MSEENNETIEAKDEKKNDKEFNFSQLRKQLESEREDKKRLEQKISDLEQQFKAGKESEEDDYDEPYVDSKHLNKRFSKFEQKMMSQFEQAAEKKASSLLEKERQSGFLKSNPDFYEVLTAENIQKFADKFPGIAENMTEMPDTFARQKLLYQNIKAFSTAEKETKKPMQEIVNERRRGPYYQPTGISSAPYDSQGDFSVTGQENAYKKMKELQAKMRL